jgi:NTP pyrophosphatase (non-canonical NTP hydrolase)
MSEQPKHEACADLLTAVLDLLRRERRRQDEKLGEQNHQPLVWLAILTEEIGEVAESALERNLNGYLEELIHVAAVAVAAYECAARGKMMEPY